MSKFVFACVLACAVVVGCAEKKEKKAEEKPAAEAAAPAEAAPAEAPAAN